MKFCRQCSQAILAGWKGWPHKDAVPLLPRMSDGHCETCGGEQALNNEDIIWLNYHSKYNTGLPDYWLLKIGIPNKWGRPYLSEGECPRCKSRTIISEMIFPNGKRETKHNCEKCGIRQAD